MNQQPKLLLPGNFFTVVRKCGLLLLAICVFIACDESEASGNAYGGANSANCHIENVEFKCSETNPYIDPMTGDVEYDVIYGNGEIAEFKWERTLAWILPSELHTYGFDLDPFSLLADYIENGKDVYVSVKSGEFARVRLRVDSEAQDLYRFRKQDSLNETALEDVFVGREICEEKGCVKDVQLSPGHYAVYYGNIDKKRYLHIVEYEEDVKDILYVQFGDENGWSCFNGGCYTRDLVENEFNSIYSQAVIKGKFMEKKPQELELTDTLIVDFTEEATTLSQVNVHYEKIRHSLHPEYGKIFKDFVQRKKVYDSMRYDYSQKDSICRACTSRPHSTGKCRNENSALSKAKEKFLQAKTLYYESMAVFKKAYYSFREHIALGINEMRIQWKVSKEFEPKLKNFKDFNKFCTMFLQRNYEEGCLNIRLPMYLRNSCSEYDKEIEVELVEFDETEDTFKLKLFVTEDFNEKCEYLIYADVYPFVPGSPFAVQFTATAPITEGNKTVARGLVWGAHLGGEISLNTICHEIGHSFGLTDLFVRDDDPTIFNVASTETNLMNYSLPVGLRIRYRPLEVVETSTNERIKLKDGNYATENQWECIRSSENCFK